jgi:hypothetical protein
VLTHDRDSRLVIAVADIDECPGAMGTSLDGVHVLRGGVLKDPDGAS